MHISLFSAEIAAYLNTSITIRERIPQAQWQLGIVVRPFYFIIRGVAKFSLTRAIFCRSCLAKGFRKTKPSPSHLVYVKGRQDKDLHQRRHIKDGLSNSEEKMMTLMV